MYDRNQKNSRQAQVQQAETKTYTKIGRTAQCMTRQNTAKCNGQGSSGYNKYQCLCKYNGSGNISVNAIKPHQEIEEAFDAVVNLNGQIMPIKVLTKQHVQQQQHQQHDSRDMLTQNLLNCSKYNQRPCWKA